MTTKYTGPIGEDPRDPRDARFGEARHDYDATYDAELDADFAGAEAGGFAEPAEIVEPEDYRGSHRREDNLYADAEYADAGYDEADYIDADYADAGYDEDHAHAYDDREAAYVPAGERAGRGAHEAAAAGGTTAAAAGGVPKRGLAMILLAVAALLLLWGIYSLTQNKNTDGAAAPATTAVATATTAANGAGNTSANQADARNSQNAQNPAQQNPADQNNQNPANPADQNAQNPAAPAPAAGALTAANAEVYVFNNSGIPNAATDTANRLDNQFNIANNSPDAATMNMPEQNFGIFPETFVFYNPQVQGAEQVAADIARRVGGTPRATNDIPQGASGLPTQATANPNAITVVIAG